MDNFARRSDADRLAFINEAAARRDVNPIIIEKDVWVCWTLRRLVQIPNLAGHLTFKGGTSLSKAYGIIERFSEDIDLTISRDAPLISDVLPPMEDGISGNERKRRTDALKAAARAYVETIVSPNLQHAIAEALGTADGWSLTLDPQDTEQQTLLFQYPKLLAYGGGFGAGRYGDGEGAYIRPRIKLEFGARAEAEPSEMRTIKPYLADAFPEELPDSEVTISTLSIERTFWEKATILHALYHGANFRPEMSRHYYDMAMLAQAGVDDAAKAKPDLLDRVVMNKSLMFPDAKASYGTAWMGALRLAPDKDLGARLREDYARMEDMFMEAPPSFDALMGMITTLEAKLNG